MEPPKNGGQAARACYTQLDANTIASPAHLHVCCSACWSWPQCWSDSSHPFPFAVTKHGRFCFRRDGFLQPEELAPVFHLLHPREHDYARIQVR